MTLTGCANQIHSAKAGSYQVTVGKVGAYKSLQYIGRTISDEILVKTDEAGNSILFAGDGKLESIIVVLPDSGRLELMSYLEKMEEWGETARQEKVEITKRVGLISSSKALATSDSIMLEFAAFNNGENWAGKLSFSSYNAWEASNGPVGSSRGSKSVVLLLPSTQITELKSLLKAAPQQVANASKAQDKSHLFK
jgi:hypothetical protein